MARTSTHRDVGGGSNDGERVILPETGEPSRGGDDASFVRSGRVYSWGRQDDSYAVWKGHRSHRPIAVFPLDSKADAERRFKDLESWVRVRSARRRSRVVRWSRRVAVGAIIAGLGVGLGALLVVIQGSVGETEASSPEPARTASTRYDDPLSGYSIRVPEGWSVASASSGTRFVSPEGDVSISIQPLPEGATGEVADDFVGSATEPWHDVALEAPVQRVIGNAPAIARGGTALDAAGARIRFLTIVIAASNARHHGVLVMVPPEWDAATGFPQVDEIISSLRSG